METSNAASYTACIPFFLNGEERKQDRLLHTGLLSYSPIELDLKAILNVVLSKFYVFTATALFVTPHSTIGN